MAIAAMGVGGVVFAVGVFLFAGNVIGFFPTVPLAGGGIFGWGKKMHAEQGGGGPPQP
jgi:hypothetical protein